MAPARTPDSILRVALDWEVDPIDPPASFGGWNTGRVVQQMFESLYEDDLEDEVASPTRLVPALATSVEISDDGTKYLFRLRENVRFHDGTPFDTEAVLFNIERMWNPDAPQYSPVAADYNRVGLEALKSVEVTGRMTILITLKEPFPEFLRYMTQEDAPGAHVFISPKALKKYGNLDIADHAPGTGPFCIDNRFSTAFGSGVRLRRNEDYWGGSPKLKGIEFKPYPSLEDRYNALLSGDVDLAYGLEGSDLDELERRGFVIIESQVPYVWYFIFNMNDPVLSDVRVRHAIAYAVDREGLSNSIFRGHTTVASGMLPPASPSFDEGYKFPYEFNPERALQLLKEAEVPPGWRLRIITASAGSGQLMPTRICEYLARNLEAIGFGAEIVRTKDWVSYCNEWRSGVPGGAGVSQMSWGMSCDVWLEQVLHSRNSSPFGFNAGYYSNPAVDRLLDKARQTQSDDQRRQLYREANLLIMDDLPVLPMLTLRRGSVCYHPRVKGFRNPRQNWHSFKNVWMDSGV
ncbi:MULTISPECIES: ABC transporter substrate-binding protein [unclassified Mesorhizobium]|uniref:ABC transporter substrate-binding protein n=1 Tax=unclassified Mesorhizobium TaxID=325217 RepID=UPI0011265BEC|nr:MULTISPECIES: ABC transporter substrate-binding protein [unclassified Mesorhizobium]MBZ9800068.1 ABC transporter substrate-binding protein [Mesorhizobium sp. ES1-4]TPJ33504.1 ABC transporter substrate-binding protein [Mesorhizobium sp. B2-6-5]